MVNPELMAFVAFLRQRQDLRQALSSVRTPNQIVAMAEEVGFAFTAQNLREALPLLGGEHWVWKGRDAAWVLAFFEGAFAEQGGELVDTSGAGSQVEWLPSRDGDWRSRKTG